MLVTTELERSFRFTDNGQEVILADPSPKFSPEAVLNFYAQTYPLLNNAKIEGPEIKDDTITYHFLSTIGTKG